MRKLGWTILFLALLAVPARAQYVPYSNVIQDQNGHGLGNLIITICAQAATGSPCTPTATIYSNATGTVESSSVPTDSVGNYSFYAAPGIYAYSVTGPGIQSYNGVLTVACIPGAIGCAGGTGTIGGTISANQLVAGLGFNQIGPANPWTYGLINNELQCFGSNGCNIRLSSLPANAGSHSVLIPGGLSIDDGSTSYSFQLNAGRLYLGNFQTSIDLLGNLQSYGTHTFIGPGGSGAIGVSTSVGSPCNFLIPNVSPTAPGQVLAIAMPSGSPSSCQSSWTYSAIPGTSSPFPLATTAGTCVSNTTGIAGAAVNMAVIASPVSNPGAGAVWSAFVSSSGNVTIIECAVASSAGGTIAFNVRVIP